MSRGKYTRKSKGGARKGASKKSKKGTRKAASRKVMSIPELRTSMQHMEAYTHQLVRSRKSPKELAGKFASEWRATFGKALERKQAEAYIKHAMSTRRNTTRRMRGGSDYRGFQNEIRGAPMDQLTRPGQDLPQGQFPTYLSKGFINPEPAISQSCGTQQGVLPQPETGSNKMGGGGLLDIISAPFSAALSVPPIPAMTNRPFIATNPVSAGHDAQMAWKGQNIGPGPEAWQSNHQPYRFGNSILPVPTYSILQRDMQTDVKGPKYY